MRNPFKRAAKPETARPTLRERLNATKARAKQVIAANAVILKGPPALAPAVDRTALINYATWLHFERYRVCGELYPHLGTKAVGFVLTANAAERFFFPDGVGNGLSKAWRNVPPASSRAVKVLDLVGVDWRTDVARGGLGHVDTAALQDNGERPSLPYGWPAPDAALTTALIDMIRVHAAIDTLPSTLDREHNELPEFGGLEEAVNEAIGTLIHTPAISLSGLQAKAKAILSAPLEHRDLEADEVARSLASDLLGATNRTITPQPDPILAAIAEARRLCTAWTTALNLPQPAKSIDPHPEVEAAAKAFHTHVDDVLLKTVPATAGGCAALARYAVETSKAMGFVLDDNGTSDQNARILDLIARSPLL